MKKIRGALLNKVSASTPNKKGGIEDEITNPIYLLNEWYNKPYTEAGT